MNEVRDKLEDELLEEEPELEQEYTVGRLRRKCPCCPVSKHVRLQEEVRTIAVEQERTAALISEPEETAVKTEAPTSPADIEHGDLEKIKTEHAIQRKKSTTHETLESIRRKSQVLLPPSNLLEQFAVKKPSLSSLVRATSANSSEQLLRDFFEDHRPSIQGCDCTAELIYFLVYKIRIKHPSSTEGSLSYYDIDTDTSDTGSVTAALGDWFNKARTLIAKPEKSKDKKKKELTRFISPYGFSTHWTERESPIIFSPGPFLADNFIRQPTGLTFTHILYKFQAKLEDKIAESRQYVVNWVRYFQSSGFPGKKRKTNECWMVTLYTGSGDVDDLTAFFCSLVRALLQHHCVAYDEKDINETRQPYKIELTKKLKGRKLTVPFVFVYGAILGGAKVVYAAHVSNLMKSVFKGFTMPQDMYHLWLTERSQVIHHEKKALPFVVPLQDFPTLRWMARGTKVKLKNTELEMVERGKNMVKDAKSRWTLLTQRKFVAYDLLKYTLLRETVRLSFRILDDIYWTAMFPNASFKKAWENLNRDDVLGKKRKSIAATVFALKGVNKFQEIKRQFQENKERSGSRSASVIFSGDASSASSGDFSRSSTPGPSPGGSPAGSVRSYSRSSVRAIARKSNSGSKNSSPTVSKKKSGTSLSRSASMSKVDLERTSSV